MIQIKFASDDNVSGDGSISSSSSSSTVLKDYLLNLYQEQTLTDCVIYCCQDRFSTGLNNTNSRLSISTTTNSYCNTNNNRILYKEFHCHRLILSAYSDFFHHYFTSISPMSSANANHIFLSEIDAKTFDNIIKLIYYGSIRISNQDEENNLFMASSKLGLKKISSTIIQPSLVNLVQSSSSSSAASTSSSTSLIGKSESSTTGKSNINHLKKRLQASTIPNQDDSIQLNSNSNNNNMKHHKANPESDSLMVNYTDTKFGNKTTSSSSMMIVNPSIGDNNDGSNNNSFNISKLALPQQQQLIPPQSSSTSSITGNVHNSAAVAIMTTGGGKTDVVHQQEPLFTCQYCQKQYTYEISLKKHIKSAHQNI